MLCLTVLLFSMDSFKNKPLFVLYQETPQQRLWEFSQHWVVTQPVWGIVLLTFHLEEKLWTKNVYKAILWSLRILLFQREWLRYSCNSSVGVPKPECEWGPVAEEEVSEELGSLWCRGRWLSPSTQRHVQGVMTTGTIPEWGYENLLCPQTQFDSHGSTFSRSSPSLSPDLNSCILALDPWKSAPKQGFVYK